MAFKKNIVTSSRLFQSFGFGRNREHDRSSVSVSAEKTVSVEPLNGYKQKSNQS